MTTVAELARKSPSEFLSDDAIYEERRLFQDSAGAGRSMLGRLQSEDVDTLEAHGIVRDGAGFRLTATHC